MSASILQTYQMPIEKNLSFGKICVNLAEYFPQKASKKTVIKEASGTGRIMISY